MPGRPKKEFHEYLTDPTASHVSHEEYVQSPASAFLRYVIEAKSAIDLCARTFPKKQNGEYTKDSLDTLQNLSVAVLPSVMGHFETFLRYLFAGMFDLSVHLTDFDVNKFFKTLSNKNSISIDLLRLSAHRSTGASSVGSLLADSMTGWHDPEQVNRYFSAFSLNFRLFGNNACQRLRVLWQLRHSIVHTGGTLTLSDAQKIAELNLHRGKQIAFQKNFVFEVARKMHPIVKSATEGIGRAFSSKLAVNVPTEAKARIDKFFEVKSSVPSWLK